jgi:pimeloyl-ACP methyl ester carboxylesterase
VLDALGPARAGYIGWSMGVQVGFEILRLRPDAFARVACIGGVAGSPFRAAMPVRGLERALPPVMDVLARVAPRVAPLLAPFIAHPGFFRAACLVGFVRPTADREVFMGMARGVAHHDPRLYLSTLAELGRQEAEALLPELGMPVLFLAGGRDTLTPRRELERLAGLVRQGSVHTVEDASHFVTIEAPDEVNRVLDEFFAALLKEREA